MQLAPLLWFSDTNIRDGFKDSMYKVKASGPLSRPRPIPVTMKIHGQGKSSFSSMPRHRSA